VNWLLLVLKDVPGLFDVIRGIDSGAEHAWAGDGSCLLRWYGMMLCSDHPPSRNQRAAHYVLIVAAAIIACQNILPASLSCHVMSRHVMSCHVMPATGLLGPVTA
jgi:hypothetical protein